MIGSLSNEDGDGNENRKKATTLHVITIFLHIS